MTWLALHAHPAALVARDVSGLIGAPATVVGVLSFLLTGALGFIWWAMRRIVNGRLVPRATLDDQIAEKLQWVEAYKISEDARRIVEETRRIQDEQIGNLLDYARAQQQSDKAHEQALAKITERLDRLDRPPGRR